MPENKYSEYYIWHQKIESPHFAFIDLANIQRNVRKYLEPLSLNNWENEQLSYTSLFRKCAADRFQIYDATEIHGKSNEILMQLKSADSFVLREGVLTNKGGRRKQQGIDILLALDAIAYAFRGIIKSATIFSDDGDFIPLVESLSTQGITVSVVGFGDPTKSVVAGQLQDAADYYRRIDRNAIMSSFDGLLNFRNISEKGFMQELNSFEQKFNEDGTIFGLSNVVQSSFIRLIDNPSSSDLHNMKLRYLEFESEGHARLFEKLKKIDIH